jgi:DNA-binding beta-propeller fold protein YncE
VKHRPVKPFGNLTATTIGLAMLAACSGNGTTSATPAGVVPMGASPNASQSDAVRPSANANDIYIANYGSNSVAIYPGSKLHPAGTITSGVSMPVALNPSGWIFVANSQPNTVTVYTNDGRTLKKTITRGMRDPKAFAFDAAGNVYIATAKAVLVFKAKTLSLLEKINTRHRAL